MSDVQIVFGAVSILFAGLTIAGAGVGAYVAATSKLVKLEAEYQAHMRFYHGMKGG